MGYLVPERPRSEFRSCWFVLVAEAFQLTPGPPTPSLVLPVGQNTHAMGNPGAQKYSALPKFGIVVFDCYLIPVRGAYRDRHETRGERRWTRAASRERLSRGTTGAVWRTAKSCGPDARGLCVKSCDRLQGDGGNSATLPGESTT